MNIDNFFTEFATESAFRPYFKSLRESKGIVCRECSATQYYWIDSQMAIKEPQKIREFKILNDYGKFKSAI